MTYYQHSENECDKCGLKINKKHLYKIPFLYCDKNDKCHPDILFLNGEFLGEGYKQYYVCEKCYDKEMRVCNLR